MIGYIIGYTIEPILYPGLAIIFRDSTELILKLIGFQTQPVNKVGYIGIYFPDYLSIVEQNGDNHITVLNGGYEAHCLTFGFLISTMGYLLIRELQEINSEEKTLTRVNVFRILIQIMSLILFYYFISVIRYLTILFTFILVWPTSYWENHYYIGHDVVGTGVVVIGFVVFFLTFHFRFRILQFLKVKTKQLID